MSSARARLALAGTILAVSIAGALCVAASAIALHVQHRLAVRENVHLTFHPVRLPEGGYYYGVIVLEPYRNYTRTSPPCSTSSDMQRTDYGYLQASGKVSLALTPSKSSTGHWCPGGSYEGAIYAVPHPPPCEDAYPGSAYPCNSEPHKERCQWPGPPPCVIRGVVALPHQYRYPDGLPPPRASDATNLAHFSISFPR